MAGQTGRVNDVVVGDDGLARCRWASSTAEYRSYHDEEWGRPVVDDDVAFETLCLEGFQAGLSWLTILRKRDSFRRAFAGFDPTIVAELGERDVQRLVGDPSIVRHEAKVRAAITNARAAVDLRSRGTSLVAILWAHEPAPSPAPVALEHLPASTPESTALSAALRRHGFRFVGPTTAYATMQALGIVNDHLEACAFRAAGEQERRRVRVPPA